MAEFRIFQNIFFYSQRVWTTASSKVKISLCLIYSQDRDYLQYGTDSILTFLGGPKPQAKNPIFRKFWNSKSTTVTLLGWP